MAQNPALERGYRKLVRGWLIYGNVPWLIMGAGILSGSVPSTFHYFNPRNGAFVIPFYVSSLRFGYCRSSGFFFAAAPRSL